MTIDFRRLDIPPFHLIATTVAALPEGLPPGTWIRVPGGYMKLGESKPVLAREAAWWAKRSSSASRGRA